MISLLDYGAGNVRSVVNALERLGETVRIVGSAGDIDTAQRLVFPGVGSFGSMRHILREKQFIEPLTAYLRAGKPFFGICLGLQALFAGSEEAPGVTGLWPSWTIRTLPRCWMLGRPQPIVLISSWS